MKNPWILPVAALAVGAVGGFISGKSSAPGENPAAEDTASRPRSSSRLESGADQAATKRNRPESTDEIYRRPGGSTRIQALMDFYAGLSPEQLDAEARKLENLPMSERMIASFLLFGRWAEVDPTAAMAFTDTMGFAGAFVRPTVLQSWASVDPANAAKYYTEHAREFAMMGAMGGGRNPMGGQGASSIIASEWARQDPDAALAWASSLATGKGDAMSSVLAEVAKTDPAKAAELLKKMDPAEQGNAVGSIASQWGASNFSDAQAWIRTLPADQQEAALARAIEGLASKDPMEAAKQIGAMQPGEAQDDAIPTVVRNMAREDPSAAGIWLAKVGSEDAQEDGMRELIPNWTKQDPAAALKYANELPAGDAKDSALASYVVSNTAAKPSDLIGVAEGIEDEDDRSRSIGMTAMRWMQEDSAAATSYIQDSDSIPDNMKERLIEGRGPWGGGGNRRRNRGN